MLFLFHLMFGERVWLTRTLIQLSSPLLGGLLEAGSGTPLGQISHFTDQ